ncbi:hypothetical protein C8J25_102243 [Sphingomonas faeni]|uniref:Uncharacterized protein n=1 Tax=Sphingomonas faeni TaxID=185950 RepID=A0A2T5U9J4_9SPHN|nr:hypothetical protein C8J25_102243 [Sphingomonas faeni]
MNVGRASEARTKPSKILERDYDRVSRIRMRIGVMRLKRSVATFATLGLFHYT